MRGEPTQKILDAIGKIQSLLPAEGYAVGEFTIADIAVAPFFARCEVFLESEIGFFEEGTGRKTSESLRTDPKFARYRKYWKDLQARESFKKTFDPVSAASESFCPSETKSWVKSRKFSKPLLPRRLPASVLRNKCRERLL